MVFPPRRLRWRPLLFRSLSLSPPPLHFPSLSPPSLPPSIRSSVRPSLPSSPHPSLPCAACAGALQPGSLCKRQAVTVALLRLRIQSPVAQLRGAKGRRQRADIAVRGLRLHAPDTAASVSRAHRQRIAWQYDAHSPKSCMRPALREQTLHVAGGQLLMGPVVLQGLKMSRVWFS
jgi:hypothetical protein